MPTMKKTAKKNSGVTPTPRKRAARRDHTRAKVVDVVRALQRQPLFIQVDQAAHVARQLATGTGDPGLVAAANILAALVESLRTGDAAALAEPHQWAARRLDVSRVIPSVDARGQLRTGIAAGFEALVRSLREPAPTADVAARRFAAVLGRNFPKVRALNPPTPILDLVEADAWIQVHLLPVVALDVRAFIVGTTKEKSAADFAERILNKTFKVPASTFAFRAKQAKRRSDR